MGAPAGGIGFLRRLFPVDTDSHGNSFPFLIGSIYTERHVSLFSYATGFTRISTQGLAGLLLVPAVRYAVQCRHLLGYHFEANESVRFANPAASTGPRG